MNPIAFYIFGLEIRWYGILIASGMLLGLLAARYTCRIKGIDYDTFLEIILIALPAGIIGARLYYVLFEFDYYRAHLSEIFNIRAGGLAIHGGVIFGALSAYLYMRHKKINFLRLGDAAAPSIILAQSIGRWGNFFNQEAHGGPVSAEFIKRFPDFIQRGMYIGGTYYHPTFLYESIWDFISFIVLLVILRKSQKNGTTFVSYIGLYSLGRFFIEGLRTDSLMLGPIRIAQLVSALGVLVCVVSLYFLYGNKKSIN